MSKKKKEMTTWEQVMIGLCVFSGVLCLLCCVPKVPYRHAAPWAGHHSRFGMDRYYSLYGATDNLGAIVSWITLRSDTCNEMRNNNLINPAQTFGINKLTSAMGQGDAIAGCAYWQLCKDHLNLRCTQYGTIMVVGLCAILFNLIGAIALFMVPMMVNSEKQFTGKSKKKKKKLVESVTLTLQTVVAGFVFPMLSYAMYMLATDSMFHTLARQSEYPYGYAFAGAFMAGAVVAFSAIALLIAFGRWTKTGKESKEESEEGSDEDGMAGAEQPDGFIDPASIGPAASMAPPGMGPPGM